MNCGICDKEMPGASESHRGVTICGSCIRSPLPSPDVDLDATIDYGYNLDYLSDEGSKERQRLDAKKSISAVRIGLSRTVMQIPVTTEEGLVSKIKLKSNHLRDRLYPIGSLRLHFNGNGIAEFPASHLAAVKDHMRLRPCRFQIVEDKSAKQVPDPSVALEEARMALEAARAALVAPTPEPEKPVVVKTVAKKTRKKKSSKSVRKS